MITIHHLSNSHSHVVLWLMEELGLPYKIVPHQRDPATGRSPDSLRAVHRAAKAPTIEDHGVTMIESTGILLYLLDAYGEGKLRPPANTVGSMQFFQWITYMEGSTKAAFMPLFRRPRDADPASPEIVAQDAELNKHLGLIDEALAGKDYIAGDMFTAADIQLTFEEEIAEAFGRLGPYPNMHQHLTRMRERPAYQRAEAKGGPVALGRARAR
jgi:glutathione S-transferase